MTTTPSRRSSAFKPPRVVATVAELYDAVENAGDGETIALKDGTYRLSEKIKLRDRELTLVGKSGNRERVKITVSGKGNSVFEINAGVKLTLEDLSLEAKEWSAIESLVAPGAATVKATRCNITTLGGQDSVQTTISWCARYILNDCHVVGGMNTAGYRRAAWVMQGGSITAENCDFTGGVHIDFESQPSLLKNCLIHDSGKGAGVDISGDSSNNRGPCCKIVDCTIYDVGGCGVCVEYGGEALVRGGEIRNVRGDNVRIGVHVDNDGSLKLDDVKISKCKQGVYVKDGGKCEATNLTFTDVDDKWCVYDDAGSVTHNGRRMTDAD